MIEAAENVRDKRAIAIRCMEAGIFNADNLMRDFLEYFRDNIKGKHRVWETAYKHFSKYVNGCCYFRNITLQLCEAYRDYLLKRATYINSNYKDPSKKKLSAASAYKCFSCFKQILKQAHKECILNEDLTSKFNTISPKSEVRREYLTEEEIKI